jgi:hypothetical protein
MTVKIEHASPGFRANVLAAPMEHSIQPAATGSVKQVVY